ncbi:MAG: phenazine biosynthesis protein PhzF family, partial [Clostridiales bacterium]|nr:phenazine biosynthesis protein PhzF family [Clostridiales bacterium]
KAGDISDTYPVDFLDAGLRTLIIPISQFEKEVSIFPNEAQLKKFCIDKGIDIILIFSKEASSREFIAHTRVFAPKFGYLEDPATGSGNSAFGNYMIKNNIWDGNPISIEQGGNDIIYNAVKLTTADGNILFGGSATLRIEGSYYL